MRGYMQVPFGPCTQDTEPSLCPSGSLYVHTFYIFHPRLRVDPATLVLHSPRSPPHDILVLQTLTSIHLIGRIQLGDSHAHVLLLCNLFDEVALPHFFEKVLDQVADHPSMSTLSFSSCLGSSQVVSAQFLIGGSLAASYLFIQLPALAQTSPLVEGLSFGNLSVESVARMGTQCVVDTAQRAAVWLNVIYLIPLSKFSIPTSSAAE